MPPNGKPYALNLVNNVIYTHTAQGCGGNPNMAYSYDLATHKVGSWGPAGGGMWGRSGPAVSKSLVMYTGTGDGRWDPENGIFGNGIIGVKQNPTTKALDLVDYYGPTNAEWLAKRDLDMQVSPAIFDYKGKEYMIDASKECRIYLMATDSIGGDDHRTPAYPDAADLQRVRRLRGGGYMGLAGDVGGQRHALDSCAVLGSQALEIQRADRARRGEEGSYFCFPDDGRARQPGVGASLDLARHEPGGAARDRERNGIRLWQRRKHVAGLPRRWPRFSNGAPRSALDSCDSICSGRAGREGVMVERKRDHELESLQRHRARQWPGV